MEDFLILYFDFCALERNTNLISFVYMNSIGINSVPMDIGRHLKLTSKKKGISFIELH